MDLEKRPQQTDSTARPTALRASDADRDRAADILREALAEGRLTADEHAERVDGVYRAKTVDELEPFVHDLPRPAGGRPRPAAAPPPDRPTMGTMPATPDESLVAVFSTSTRRGRWKVARRTHAVAVFGTVTIDLSEALFEHQQVLIKALSVFGSIEILIPENVSLRGNGGGVLGEFKVDALDSPDGDAPVVYVDGLAVLGSVEAKPKRGRFISDLQDRLRKYFD